MTRATLRKQLEALEQLTADAAERELLRLLKRRLRERQRPPASLSALCKDGDEKQIVGRLVEQLRRPEGDQYDRHREAAGKRLRKLSRSAREIGL